MVLLTVRYVNMRNATTEQRGHDLSKAQVKSKLTVQAFMLHIAGTREVFQVDYNAKEFFIVIDGEINHFYYAGNKWNCKI